MRNPTTTYGRAAVLFGLVAALLAGCSSDDDAAAEPTATPTIVIGGEETPTSAIAATSTPTIGVPDPDPTSTPTIEVPDPDPTSTPTASDPTPTPTGPDPTPTPTVSECSTSDSCSGSHTDLLAVAHSHNDPDNTLLYRVTVPAASTGTSWGDGDNGFFYQVALSNAGGDSETLTYVPFNGIGAGSDGQPALPQFWFIVPADTSYTTMAVSLCASSYLADSGSTPVCTASLWTDTYSTLPSPSVGDPPFGSVSLQIAGADSTQVTVPNNGVYPGTVTLDVSGTDLDDDDIQWLYDHMMFFDEDSEPYTNDLSADSSETHRSIGVLSIDEAAYQDPVEGTYRTKYGTTDAIEKVDSPDRQFFFYTADILGTSAIDVGISYIYDQAADCRGYVSSASSKDSCSDSTGAATSGSTDDITPQVEVLPESGQNGAISAFPQNSIEAGQQENRILTFDVSTSTLCGKVTNPLAINESGAAYNQPDYVIDDTSGTWGMSFPRGLYYVVPTGFGNCDSTTTPFCHLTSGYSAYAPHYANSNGAFGTLNGGSTTESTVGSLALADEYSLGSAGLASSNSLVWFDNCGYGYIYEECSSCDNPLGTRLTLPSPPSDRDSYEYTITNGLEFPIVLGKECCSSYYQENQSTGTYEPPAQLDDSFGAFIPAGGSLAYETLFSDETTVVYNAATGEELFKLRLNADSPAVYSCDHTDVSVTIGDSAPYGVEIAESGVGDLECGTIGQCPFGMTASVDGQTVTCTTTESSFLLGISDWVATLSSGPIQIRAWGGRSVCGDNDADAGFALTVQQPSDLDQVGYYAYVGEEGDCTASAASLLMLEPLSLLTSSVAKATVSPAGLALVIAGGAGHRGQNNGLGSVGSGGAGGHAIANTDPSGDAVSAEGSGGHHSSGFPCDDTSGGHGGNSDGLGSGGSHDGEAGLGGISPETFKVAADWGSSGSLIPPSSWSAGKGGSNGDNGQGGGGFGGGGGGGENTCSVAGGGGGGSWAAANTIYDSTAPTSAPDSPNGDNGAIEIVYEVAD